MVSGDVRTLSISLVMRGGKFQGNQMEFHG